MILHGRHGFSDRRLSRQAQELFIMYGSFPLWSIQHNIDIPVFFDPGELGVVHKDPYFTVLIEIGHFFDRVDPQYRAIQFVEHEVLIGTPGQ